MSEDLARMTGRDISGWGRGNINADVLFYNKC